MQAFLTAFEKFCEKPGVASNKARAYAKAIKYLCDYLNVFKMDSEAVAKIKSLEKDIRDKDSTFFKEFMSFLEERKQKSYLEGGFVQAALTPLFEFEQKYLKIKEKFRTWFIEQPQRKNPAVKYNIKTIDAAIRLLESGMSKLQIDEYASLNCFDITNYMEFRHIHKACYEAAETYDKKEGFGDFRNGLDYYLLFLRELSNQSISEKVEEIIQAYKADFPARIEDERYKWEAVKKYKETWNIDDPNFAAMLTVSFKYTWNLLKSGNYYPYKMLVLFAEKEPETVRTLFKTLYDEKLPFEERCSRFQKGFDEYYNPQNLRHYQDLHAISVYLSCEYPEKYYIYKYSVIKEFIKQTGYECGNIDTMTDSEKMELTIELHNTVLDAIDLDCELQLLYWERLDTSCYQDDSLHILTNDVIHFGSKYTESEEDLEEMDLTISKNEFDKNIILYGPPGTGKTYNTAIYAVAIIENKSLEDVSSEDYTEVICRYNEYKREGKIEFTTFHQSYGYEEFIEGIKPIITENSDDSKEVTYDVLPGVFKAFCDKIITPEIKGDANTELNDYPTVWKVSLQGTGDNPTRSECLANNHIRIGYDECGEDATQAIENKQEGYSVLNKFINEMSVGDLVVSCYTASTIDAIGVVTGECEWHPEYEHYKRLRKVKWLVKGIEENILKINNGKKLSNPTVHSVKMSVNDVMEIVKKHSPDIIETKSKGNYVFIIDEINRGNISKILGELITLIEPTKRLGQAEELQAKLPYSQKEFGVPDNVYIIGTMNTADRSIAAIDTALRRRFSFKEMLPQTDVLDGIEVEGVSVSKMLEKMNRRIEVLYDREHTIGHAYFISLKYDNSVNNLADIFKNKILPLLQEYFYEDYDKIRLVLGDNQKNEESEFIVKEQVNEIELFGEDTDIIEDAYKYSINDSAFKNIEAYKKMI